MLVFQNERRNVLHTSCKSAGFYKMCHKASLYVFSPVRPKEMTVVTFILSFFFQNCSMYCITSQVCSHPDHIGPKNLNCLSYLCQENLATIWLLKKTDFFFFFLPVFLTVQPAISTVEVLPNPYCCLTYSHRYVIVAPCLPLRLIII